MAVQRLARLHLGPLVLIALIPSAPARAVQAGPPGWVPHNVVLIVADDLGVDMIGAYEPYYAGHPNPTYQNTTPNLDKLAAEGLLFRNAWVPPVCSASRAAMLTGMHAHRSGVGTVIRPELGSAGLSSALGTIPSLLDQLGLGYQSAALGKWHLAGAFQFPPPPGEPIHPLGTNTLPWFQTYAGSFQGGVASYNAWDKTFAGAEALPSTCTPTAGSYCIAPSSTYATVDTTEDAIHMLGIFEANQPAPFFLFLSFNAPHVPFGAPAQALPDPPGGCPLVKPGHDDCLDLTAPDGPRDARCMVEWLDYEIGRFLCSLDSSSLGPTTVMFVGDNGNTGNQEIFGMLPPPIQAGTTAPFNPAHAKGTLYQGGVNVPLIVRSPLIGDTTPTLVESTDALVCATDFMATAEHLATGIPPAYGPVRDSHSFVPVLEGSVGSVRTHAFVDYFESNFTYTGAGSVPAGFVPDEGGRAIRDLAGNKLIQLYDGDGCGDCIEERFFDLSVDPHETQNIIERALDPDDPLNVAYRGLLTALAPYPTAWPEEQLGCPGVRYCPPGTSASGCQALVRSTGRPSANAGSGYCLSATGVEGGKDGLMFFGTNGRQAQPWGSSSGCTSFQCVTPPVVRTPLIQGTGNPGRCNGVLTGDLNLYWSLHPQKNPGAGSVVQAQFWYRDVSNPCPEGTSMSEAIEFILAP